MSPRIARAADLPELIDQLGRAERVAVDTEFHAERRYIPELFLVQVQIPGADGWIIDPLVDDLLPGIADALCRVPWLVHGGSQDLRLMHRALGGLPEDIVDTQIGAGLAGERYPMGYGKLVSAHLGIDLPKSATLSDWSQRPLSPEQLRYAIDDVARLPELWGAIVAEVEALGREEHLAAACRDYRAHWMVEPEPADAWRRIAAAEGMDARSRSVLREVCAWREKKAQDKNQPPRSILHDGLVIEVSKRPPGSVGALLANRRFPRSARRYVDDLMAAIRRGLDTDPSDVPPHVVRHSEPWRAAAVVHAWSLVLGRERRWAPSLVVPSHVVHQVLLDPPSSRSHLAHVLGDWRDALVGDDLWALWSGEAALALPGGTGSVRR